MWLQFRERMVDPALESVGGMSDRIDTGADAAAARTRGLRKWLQAWFARLRNGPGRQ